MYIHVYNNCNVLIATFVCKRVVTDRPLNVLVTGKVSQLKVTDLHNTSTPQVHIGCANNADFRFKEFKSVVLKLKTNVALM